MFAHDRHASAQRRRRLPVVSTTSRSLNIPQPDDKTLDAVPHTYQHINQNHCSPVPTKKKIVNFDDDRGGRGDVGGGHGVHCGLQEGKEGRVKVGGIGREEKEVEITWREPGVTRGSL